MRRVVRGGRGRRGGGAQCVLNALQCVFAAAQCVGEGSGTEYEGAQTQGGELARRDEDGGRTSADTAAVGGVSAPPEAEGAVHRKQQEQDRVQSAAGSSQLVHSLHR